MANDAPGVIAARTAFSEAEAITVAEACREIMRTGRLVLGPYTERFEAAWARFIGSRHAVDGNSGSAALEVIFRAIGVVGKLVLLPTNTNFATAAAAQYAGASVRLVDGGLSIDVGDLEQKITDDTGAVVIVHIG